MKEIFEYTDEELLQELKQREANRIKNNTAPPPLANPDFSGVISLVTDGVLDKIKGEGNQDELKYLVWEAAMEAIYGDSVWRWFNKIPG